MLSASVVLQVFVLPLTGAIADRTGRKREMLAGFAFLGALATTALFFAGDGRWLLAAILFVVANIAVLGVSCGPALAAGLATVGRRVLGPAILVGGALVAVAGADISGLSKAEVERIWLPFVPWLVGVAGFLPDDERLARVLLAANAAVAIAVPEYVLP